MALKLKLKAGEKIVINGAVIVNGDRPIGFTVQNFAQILRENDVMQEDEATTPVKRAYYVAQLMLLDSENTAGYAEKFESFVADLQQVFLNAEVQALLNESMDAYHAGNYYKVLAALRKVMKYEAVLLAGAKVRELP